MSATKGIARYFLYEESLVDVEADFLHIEAIPVRSGKHDWTIHAHTHPRHTQLLFVSAGSGRLRIEERTWEVKPPCLMVIPAGMVHEIRFEPGTDGFVGTIADACLNDACREEPMMIDAAAEPGVHDLSADIVLQEAIETGFAKLLREFLWIAPGRRIAIKAHLQHILVVLLRLRDNQQGNLTVAFSGQRDVVLRYRSLVETHFRVEKRLDFYADRLAVTLSKLNSCCRSILGISASRVLHDRMIVEAKRNLIYTAQSVSEVAHSIGFEDPAYFSRFFTRHTGIPPGAFRQKTALGSTFSA